MVVSRLRSAIRLSPSTTPGLLILYSALVHGLLGWWLAPGLGGDPARLGLHALDFLKRGVWPFYIYHLFAPNPLIVFLHALAFTVSGVHLAALQGTTIAAGILTAAAAYLASREAFADHSLVVARRAGLIAGLSVPLNTILNGLVRGGTEHALLPLLSLLTLAALWRGLRRGRTVDFALAGVVLGLSQYAYIVARALPVAFGLALAVTAALHPTMRARRRGLLVMALIFGLIALPQWWLFVQAPYTLVARSQQSAGQFIFAVREAGSLWFTKLANQATTLGWRWAGSGYNPSERPLLNAVLFAGFCWALVGTLVPRAVWEAPERLKTLRLIPFLQSRPASQLFVLVLTLSMLAVDLVTVEGVWPSATRMLGALPFVLMLAGLGCAQAWGWLEIQPRFGDAAGRIVVGAVVLAGLESQWHLITQVEPRVLAAPGREWMSSLVEQAEADHIRAHPDQAILLPAIEYERAPLAFLLAERYPERASGLPLPYAPGDPVRVLMPASPERPTTDGVPVRFIEGEWVLLKDGVVYFLPHLPEALAALETGERLYARNGALAAQVAYGRWRAVEPEIIPASFSFRNGLELVGYDVSALIPGRPLTLALYWRAQHPIADDVQIFVQVLDWENGFIAGMHDWPLRGAYRVVAWRPGEIIPLFYHFDIPADLPPGGYRVVVGVFDILQQRRIPLMEGAEEATVITLKHPLPPPTTSPINITSAVFGQQMKLNGYTFAIHPGQVSLQLYWQALAVPDFDYTMFVHLMSASGELAAQHDAEPLAGRYPTSLWQVGEVVFDEKILSVPAGTYDVFIGVYRWDTGERLPVTGTPAADNRLYVGRVTVP